MGGWGFNISISGSHGQQSIVPPNVLAGALREIAAGVLAKAAYVVGDDGGVTIYDRASISDFKNNGYNVEEFSYSPEMGPVSIFEAGKPVAYAAKPVFPTSGASGTKGPSKSPSGTTGSAPAGEAGFGIVNLDEPGVYSQNFLSVGGQRDADLLHGIGSGFVGTFTGT